MSIKHNQIIAREPTSLKVITLKQDNKKKSARYFIFNTIHALIPHRKLRSGTKSSADRTVQLISGSVTVHTA